MIRLRPWKGSQTHYEVDITLVAPSGQRKRWRVKAPVSGRHNAERWARAREQALLAQLLAPPAPPEVPPTPTFREFAVTFMDACRADRLGPNTLRNYDVHLRVHILPVVGDRRLDELRERDLVELKTRLRDRTRSTAGEVLKTLKAMLGRAIRLDSLERMPVALEIPRRIRREPVAYTPEEVDALLATAAEDGPQSLLAVLLGLDGGLRRGEILALRWDDINLDRLEMTIRATVVGDKLGETTKGHADAIIGITRRLAAALRDQRPRSPRGFVLVNAHGAHWDQQALNRMMRRLVRKAGIRWLGTHVLRRTCATRIADNGGGVAAIAVHLRHSGLQMASRYVDRRSRGASSAIVALESARLDRGPRAQP